jgi:hypothetical protein
MGSPATRKHMANGINYNFISTNKTIQDGILKYCIPNSINRLLVECVTKKYSRGRDIYTGLQNIQIIANC